MADPRRITEGVFAGTIAPDHDNGGTCKLVLAGGRFELTITRYAPYSIEDGLQLSGAYSQDGENLAFAAEELSTYTWETVKQERRERLIMRFSGYWGTPEDPANSVRPLVVTIPLQQSWPSELVLWPVPAP